MNALNELPKDRGLLKLTTASLIFLLVGRDGQRRPPSFRPAKAKDTVMKTKTILAAVLVSTLVFTSAQAQQYPNPTTAAEVPGPMPGTAMTTAYVQTVGRMAYLWGWPLVNVVNRADAFSKAPEPGLLGGVVPVAFNRNAMLTGYISPEERFVTCPNQDVVYGAGFFALDKEPIVFQVPEFGDRFWVYPLYDARTDEFSAIGKAYGTKPGFYLMVGPDWKGELPAGITAVVRSSTASAFCAPRIFMDDTAEDHAAIQSVLNGRLLPAVGVRREDEDQGLEQAPAFPGTRVQRRDQVGEPGHLFRPVAGVDEERAAAAGRGGSLPMDRQCAGRSGQGPGDHEDA
jgi:hypothetical protein